MAENTFLTKVRSFFGLGQEPPRNDFRNPIWGSDDEDDGDELYTRQQMNLYRDPLDMHREFAKQMHDMFKSFGNMFGDVKTFFHDDLRTFFHEDEFNYPASIDEPDDENFTGQNIRDYYLKPGYHNNKNEQPKQDVDLDGKISSHEISGLLKNREDGLDTSLVLPFDGATVPGRSFCQTIITTSITKPDGSIETRRIVKKGNEVVEETTTSLEPGSRTPVTPFGDPITNNSFVLNNVMSELSSLFRNFY